MRVVHPRIPLLSSIAIGILLALGGALTAASADTFTVTNTNGSGDGSLSQAVDDANGSSGHDHIVFASGVNGTIVPDNTLLITETVTITGPGADVLSVNGGALIGVFSLSNTAGTVNITDLTIENGNATGNGAGINVDASTLVLRRCAVLANKAVGTGAGVMNDGGSVTLSECLFADNLTVVGEGGGFYTTTNASITNCTFSGNSAAGLGGDAIFVDAGTTTLAHCTVTNNSPTTAVVINDGILFADNSILAGNFSTDVDVVGSGAFNPSNVITGVDPMLGPLQDNGGPTFTHAPSGSSPAVNHGTCNGLTIDQRLFSRPQGPNCDIGAVELRYPVAHAGPERFICTGGSVTIGGTPTATGGESTNFTYSWTPTTGLDDPSAANPSASPAGTTLYSVKVTDLATDFTDTDDVRVNVSSKPTAAVSGGGPICPGDSATISAALTGAAPWDLVWSDGFNQNGVTSSPATRRVSPASTTTYTVTTVTDAACSNSGTGSATVNVNPGPTATINGPSPVCPSSAQSYSVTTNASSPSFLWSVTGGSINGSATGNSVNVTAGAAGTMNVKVKVTSGGGGCSVETTKPVTVGDSQPPSIGTCAPPQTITAGSGGTAAVPDFTATTSASDNCGGVTKSQSPTAGTLLGPGTYTVTITVRDGSNNPVTCQSSLTVNPNGGGGCTDHTAPTVTGVSASPSVLWPPDHKLKKVTINYTATDASPPVTCVLSVTSSEAQSGVCDGDTSPDWVIVDAHTVQLRAERSPGSKSRTYTVTITCTDACGNKTVKTVKVIVAHNIDAPVCGNLFKLGNTCSFHGAFWDIAGRKHTARWTFDGLSCKGSVLEPSGYTNGGSSASYKFGSTGVYKVQMNLTDDKSVTSYANTNGDISSIVVVYDPSGAYIAGGGWFNSPAGALKANTGATGKASFGFISGYYASATNPKGETQFEFKVGGFEFHADNFEKLTVTGSKAQYKGTGKVTGDASSYGFYLTVTDGQISGGGGVDRIRMKIWKKSTNAVVYDSQSGASDAASPTVAVGSASSIVFVSSAARASASQATTPPAGEVDAMRAVEFGIEQNVPNPFSNTAVVRYSLPVECEVQMRVYDVTGREVGVMVDGVRPAGHQTAEFDATRLSGGVYFYRFEARSLDGAQRFAKTRKMLIVK